MLGRVCWRHQRVRVSGQSGGERFILLSLFQVFRRNIKYLTQQADPITCIFGLESLSHKVLLVLPATDL